MNRATLLRKVRRIPTKIRELISILPYQVMAWWIDHVIRHPVWYTDQFGITSQLRPRENNKHILSTHSHFDDLGVLSLLPALLEPGMTVVDVGAYKGEFSLHAARLIQPGGVVHAFEPVKYTYDYFCENVAHSPDLAKLIIVNRTAIYRDDCEITIHTFPPEMSSWNSLGVPHMGRDSQFLIPQNSETVEGLTLDTYCEQTHIGYIDLLKIDVEGFEVDVIEGAKALLREGRIRNIIFEISLEPLRATARTAYQVLSGFTSCNLSVQLIRQDGSLEPITDITDFNAPYFANYLARPIKR